MTALVVTRPATIARATIAQHGKTFALASRLLPARVRDQTAIVYAWCRHVDDIVDEGRGGADALAALGDELDAAYAGCAADPIVAAFGAVARERSIPRVYPRELLAGMAMDVEGARYVTLDHLIAYAWRVAGVVGLMMTHVFGVRDDAALVPAAHLGIAMQLTNVCRDVAEDWQRGRLYVPDELLLAHGAGGLRGELGGALPRTARAPLAGAVKELLAIADRYYRSADRGLVALPWRAALAVRAARRLYAAIGRAIARADHDVTAGRAYVPRGEKIVRALASTGVLVVTSPRWLVRGAPRIPHRILELADVSHP